LDAGAGGDWGGVSAARSTNILRLAFAFAFAADRRHEAKYRGGPCLLGPGGDSMAKNAGDYEGGKGMEEERRRGASSV
jgi:hypothetical protein